MSESARMVYYNNRLMHLSKTAYNWRELRHLGICPSKPVASLFSLDANNEYFSGVTLDPLAPSVKEFINSLFYYHEIDSFSMRSTHFQCAIERTYFSCGVEEVSSYCTE